MISELVLEIWCNVSCEKVWDWVERELAKCDREWMAVARLEREVRSKLVAEAHVSLAWEVRDRQENSWAEKVRAGSRFPIGQRKEHGIDQSGRESSEWVLGHPWLGNKLDVLQRCRSTEVQRCRMTRGRSFQGNNSKGDWRGRLTDVRTLRCR